MNFPFLAKPAVSGCIRSLNKLLTWGHLCRRRGRRSQSNETNLALARSWALGEIDPAVQPVEIKGYRCPGHVNHGKGQRMILWIQPQGSYSAFCRIDKVVIPGYYTTAAIRSQIPKGARTLPRLRSSDGEAEVSAAAVRLQAGVVIELVGRTWLHSPVEDGHVPQHVDVVSDHDRLVGRTWLFARLEDFLQVSVHPYYIPLKHGDTVRSRIATPVPYDLRLAPLGPDSCDHVQGIIHPVDVSISVVQSQASGGEDAWGNQHGPVGTV